MIRRILHAYLATTDKLPPLLEADRRVIAFFVGMIACGGIAAFASLLGQEAKPLSKRTIFFYIVAGCVASLVVVLLLVEYYGPSYFLTGIAILAGYKAVDVLAILGMGIKRFLSRFLDNKEKK